MNLTGAGSRGTLEGQTLGRTQNSPSLGLHTACRGLSAFRASSFSVDSLAALHDRHLPGVLAPDSPAWTQHQILLKVALWSIDGSPEA